MVVFRNGSSNRWCGSHFRYQLFWFWCGEKTSTVKGKWKINQASAILCRCIFWDLYNSYYGAWRKNQMLITGIHFLISALSNMVLAWNNNWTTNCYKPCLQNGLISSFLYLIRILIILFSSWFYLNIFISFLRSLHLHRKYNYTAFIIFKS